MPDQGVSMKRIIVVGGGAGGASFAARMRRLDETAVMTLFDKGDFISFANCGLPYYIGNTIKERDNLLIQTPLGFKKRFNIDVKIRTEVKSIDGRRKKIVVQSEGNSREESFDYLLLAPGVMPVRPKIRGIESPHVHTLRTIPDTDRIRALVDTGTVKSAVVIGGGFIGLEMAENFRQRGIEVTLVEMLDQVFAPADREMAENLHRHLTMNGVRLLLKNGVTDIVDDGTGNVAVIVSDGNAIRAQLVLLAIGVKPDTAFIAGSGVMLAGNGAVVVDDHMKTSVDGIYAVGDGVEIEEFVTGKKMLIPLAGPAARQGRIAADNIAGIPSTYKKTQGTAICKVFDLTAAVTGLNEKNALQWGIPCVKSYTHSSSHASYYPGAYPLSIKLLFSPDSGQLLGAQVIGKDGIDKRIDVFATAIRRKMTVEDLSELELAYAPPFGSAKDPVNMAGFVARNILEKRMPVFYSEEIAALDPARGVLLDVRTTLENEQGCIPGSQCIPVDSLRDRLSEIDKNKMVFVYCQVGVRGYLATRILLANGFRAKNLSGGYKTWSSESTVDYDGTFIKKIS